MHRTHQATVTMLIQSSNIITIATTHYFKASDQMEESIQIAFSEITLFITITTIVAIINIISWTYLKIYTRKINLKSLHSQSKEINLGQIKHKLLENFHLIWLSRIWSTFRIIILRQSAINGMKNLKQNLSKETVKEGRNCLCNRDKCLMELFLNLKAEKWKRKRKPCLLGKKAIIELISELPSYKFIL